MGILEPKDLNFLFKKNGKLKKLGKEEIYMKTIPQKSYGSALSIFFEGGGSLKEKTKKLRKLGIKVEYRGPKYSELIDKFFKESVEKSAAFLAEIRDNSCRYSNQREYNKTFQTTIKNESLKLSNPDYKISEKQFKEIADYM